MSDPGIHHDHPEVVGLSAAEQVDLADLETGVVPVPDEPLPHPSVYPLFDRLLKRIVDTPDYVAAAGPPSPEWAPLGPGFLLAQQVVAEALDRFGAWPDAGPTWLLIGFGDPEDFFQPWWVLVGSPAGATQALDDYPDFEFTELVELVAGRSLRPREVVTMTWVESQCQITGVEGEDPTDHETHSHQEVTFR